MNNPTQSQSPIFPTSILLCIFAFTVSGICQAADGTEAPVPTIERDWNGDTALHRAAQGQDLTELRKLLADPQLNTAIIEATNRYTGYTPLHIAAESGTVGVVQAFLECNGVTDKVLRATNQYGETAVHVAAHRGETDVLESFLASHKVTDTILEIPDQDGNSLLHSAAMNLFSDNAQALVDSDRMTTKIMNATNRRGRTPLHSCIHNSDMLPAEAYTFALMLLNKKNHHGDYQFTQSEAPDNDGLTPLQEALEVDSYEKRLLPCTPLQYQELEAGHPNIFSALIGRRITINVDKDGPVAEAIRTHGLDSKECQALLAAQSKSDARDSQKSLGSITRHPKRKRADSLDEDEEGGAAAEAEAEDTITHESQLRRTVDPNVGTTKRIPMY